MLKEMEILFSIGSQNKGTTLHRGDGGGKLYFLLLKLIKRKKAQFWAKCLNSFCRRLQVPCCLVALLLILPLLPCCPNVENQRQFLHLTYAFRVYSYFEKGCPTKCARLRASSSFNVSQIQLHPDPRANPRALAFLGVWMANSWGKKCMHWIWLMHQGYGEK